MANDTTQVNSFFRYKVIGDLTSWMLPNKVWRGRYRSWLKLQDVKKQIPFIKANYARLLQELPTVSGKIKVLFLVNEVSKWKAQSLFDILQASSVYEPVIALTLADFQDSLGDDQKRQILSSNFEFFNKKGMNCVYAFDVENLEPIDLREFAPKIVFYQQPWRIYTVQRPLNVSNFALTFYIPYYVQNYGHLQNECCLELHQTVFRYYILNKQWEELYKKCFLKAAGTISGLGHTMLDVLTSGDRVKSNKQYVIYAPHHSIDNFENYATFVQNGREILEYAKQHQEFNWVFKPHPTLKNSLIEHNVMSEDEVKTYYDEWAKFATLSNDSDYYKLFLESRLLITDCASFLTEYFCTGKPIIHLVSSRSKIKPYPSFKVILDVLYKAKNLDGMYKLFDELLIKNNDYMKDKRHYTLQECGLLGNNAAKNIFNDLENLRNGGV